MDAFFAAVEQRDHPELRGKAIAIGSPGKRGVLTTASYEARRYGVRSAMPSVIAQRKCPHLIFVRPRFEAYKEASMQVHQIFRKYTDWVEPLSIDEAFLDVTENKLGIRSAIRIAQLIKKDIYDTTGLTASAGISINKFLAKIASDYQKPNGLFVILPEEAEAFVEKLPIEKFFGVGKVTAKHMHEIGINNGFDLKQKTKAELIEHFGKMGAYFYDVSRACDNRPVWPNRQRKSIGAERTFAENISEHQALKDKLFDIAQLLFERIDKAQTKAYTLSLKVKFSDFTVTSRSRSLELPFDNFDLIWKHARMMLNPDEIYRPVRLLGLSVSNFDKEQTSTEDAKTDGIQLKIEFPNSNYYFDRESVD